MTIKIALKETKNDPDTFKEGFQPKDPKYELYDLLINYSIATEDEIRLVCDIIGFTVETMEKILFAKTGYRNFEQLK